MKKLIAILALVISAQAMSANYGKFRLSMYDWEAIFLLNSNGEVLEIENDDYMTIEPSNFFGETTLSVTSMGDEDALEGTISLKNNRITHQCSAFVDYKNEYLSVGEGNLTLERWSKSKKKFVPVKMNRGAYDAAECLKSFTDEYPEYEAY